MKITHAIANRATAESQVELLQEKSDREKFLCCQCQLCRWVKWQAQSDTRVVVRSSFVSCMWLIRVQFN